MDEKSRKEEGDRRREGGGISTGILIGCAALGAVCYPQFPYQICTTMCIMLARRIQISTK